jgi:hypothetical protein
MAMNPIFVTGKCDWAKLIQPNTRYDKHFWEIDLRLEDETAKLSIESFGGTVKMRTEDYLAKGYEDAPFGYIKCKHTTENKNGPRKAPTVVDSQNNPWDDKLIGNGSIVVVKVQPYAWNNNGRSGISLDFERVQVLDLVPYAMSEDFTVVEGGYINPEAIQSQAESDIPFGN